MLKLTQFAGDNTLILDGSQPSLQAALNIFWNWSSLSNNLVLNSNTNIVQSCIWYNAHISFKINITLFSLLSNGEIIKVEDIERMFKITI